MRPPSSGWTACRPADLVLFCVKSFDTESAGRSHQARGRAGHGRAARPERRGQPGEARAPSWGTGHVMGGIAQVLRDHRVAGRHQPQVPGAPDLRRDGRAPESTRAQGISRSLRRAADPGEISLDHPSRTLWGKYVLIAAQAGMTALTRCPAGVIRSVPETRRLYRLLLDEMVALARRGGGGSGAGASSIRAMGDLDGSAPAASLLASLRPDGGQATGDRRAPGSRRAARRAPRHRDADALRGLRSVAAVSRRSARGGQVLASVY